MYYYFVKSTILSSLQTSRAQKYGDETDMNCTPIRLLYSCLCKHIACVTVLQDYLSCLPIVVNIYPSLFPTHHRRQSEIIVLLSHVPSDTAHTSRPLFSSYSHVLTSRSIMPRIPSGKIGQRPLVMWSAVCSALQSHCRSCRQTAILI